MAPLGSLTLRGADADAHDRSRVGPRTMGSQEYQLFKTFTEVARLVESKGLQPMVQVLLGAVTARGVSEVQSSMTFGPSLPFAAGPLPAEQLSAAVRHAGPHGGAGGGHAGGAAAEARAPCTCLTACCRQPEPACWAATRRCCSSTPTTPPRG